MNQTPPKRLAKFANTQTTCIATGLAMGTGTGNCYYAAAAGTAMGTRSIWASLVSNNSGVRCYQWWNSREFSFGQKGAKTLWSNLPDSSYKHFVSYMPDPNLILLIDPKAAANDGTANIPLRLARMDEAYLRFYIWMKQSLDIPVLQHWVPLIWKSAQNESHRSIDTLITSGDCIGGWLIDPKWKWVSHIVSMIKRGELTFQEE